MLISIEGIVGSGKSTLLKLLKRVGIPTAPREQDDFKSNRPTPNQIDNMNGFVTIMKELLERVPEEDCVIQEESIWTTYYIKSALNYNQDVITSEEFNIITNYFKYLANKSRPIQAIIYIKMPAAKAFERIRKRGDRKGTFITLDYLKGLESFYEQIFEEFEDEFQVPILKIDGTLLASEIMQTLMKFVSKCGNCENKGQRKLLPLELEVRPGIQSIHRSPLRYGFWVLEESCYEDRNKTIKIIEEAIEDSIYDKIIVQIGMERERELKETDPKKADEEIIVD